MKNNMYKEIFKIIKKFNNIVIARHINADMDALGSQLGLKDIIKETFPDKKVYAVGAYSAKFKFVGPLDKEENIDYDNTLLIVTDTPKTSRVDVDDISLYKNRIRIDHHPFEEKFCDIELVNEDKSSTCEMIADLCYETKLKITKSAAEKLYMGIVADTNRFLYPCTSSDTLLISSKLVKEFKLDTSKLYEMMYLRSIDEIRFMGYFFQNLKTTQNGVGYIKITDEIQKEYKMDPASIGNMIGELAYVDELLVWITFSEDVKQNLVRVSVRSRGPAINTIAMQYNGGGHKLASGIRLPNFDLSDEIVSKLDELCYDYNNKKQ
jgi:phosphoesterase RecJ-like protein